MSVSLDEAAARLVADLMPVAIVVAELGGNGAAAFAQALEAAGAGAEIYAAGLDVPFDLAVLLADAQPGQAGVAPVIEGLAAICDRLLFVPAAGPARENGRPGAAPDLDAWFELLAEQGYQPVVDYDASFLGQGAFLVDRNATAAEVELSAFAERLSMGGALAASTQRVAVLEAELGTAGDRDAIKAELSARQAELAAALAREQAWRERAETAEAEAASLRAQVAGWQGMARRLGQWIGLVVAAPSWQTLESLRAAAGRSPRRGLLARLRGRRAGPSKVELQQLADAALVRGSRLFDAGWYIASQTGLAETGADPVWHYVLRGAASGADPGPWFDSAAYRAAHRDAAGNPLAHAIRHGHVNDKHVPGSADL